MKWEVASEETSAVLVYEILKHHRLLPQSEVVAASICNVLGTGERYVITDGSDLVANLFVTVSEDTGIAQFDLVPVVKYFRTGFDEPIREAVLPLIFGLFETKSVRRVESSIPASRSRTKRALCAIGFKPEGRLVEGVALYGKEPEDVRMLGLLKSYIKEGVNNGS